MTGREGVAAGAPVVVLVVEDEPVIRMAAVDFLEDDGFAVVEAATADAALALLRTRPDVGVLFTDVDMPGSMDGLALARLVAAEHPGMAVLVVSGKTQPRPGEMPAGARFLPKPYAIKAMLDHVRTASGAA